MYLLHTLLVTGTTPEPLGNTNTGECSEAGNISHMCLKAVTGTTPEPLGKLNRN
jgi:hypothetical protein